MHKLSSSILSDVTANPPNVEQMEVGYFACLVYVPLHRYMTIHYDSDVAYGLTWNNPVASDVKHWT
jgi:hypothetical protein